MRGGVEWKIQHDAKASAVFDTTPHPHYYIFHTLQVNGTLTDLFF